MPRHKHYKLIQKWIQDPNSFEVFCRASPRSDWLEEGCPVWLESFEYKLEPKDPAGFLWYIETTEYEYPTPSQIVTRRDFNSILEFVQALYEGQEIEIVEGKLNEFQVVGFVHVKVHSTRQLTTDQLKVLQDLNICSL